MISPKLFPHITSFIEIDPKHSWINLKSLIYISFNKGRPLLKRRDYIQRLLHTEAQDKILTKFGAQHASLKI